MKYPISAIVVGFNEAHLLEKSLPALSFCDEILYFDLGSKDNSMATAQKHGAQVFEHARVDGCEWVHVNYFNKTKHEWVLITDPDEVISTALVNEIKTMFDAGIDPSVGSISVPWIFYFKNKPLKGTNWGGVNRRIVLINNKRFEFLPLIHVSRQLLPGFKQLDIPHTGQNHIHHYWMFNYAKLFNKHLRYLKHEGEARYKTGRSYVLKSIVKEPYRSFKYSFISKQGYKDGLTGLFLSLFWAWYETTAQLKTRSFKKKTEYQSR